MQFEGVLKNLDEKSKEIVSKKDDKKETVETKKTKWTITLDSASKKLNVKAGVKKIIAKITSDPESKLTPEILWEVSDTAIVSMNKTTGTELTVKALKNGEVKVIGTLQVEGTPSGSFDIRVSNQPKLITLKDSEVAFSMDSGKKIKVYNLCTALKLPKRKPTNSSEVAILFWPYNGLTWEMWRYYNRKYSQNEKIAFSYRDLKEEVTELQVLSIEKSKAIGAAIFKDFNSTVKVNQHLAVQISKRELKTIHLMYHHNYKGIKYAINVHAHVKYQKKPTNFKGTVKDWKKQSIKNNKVAFGKGNCFISGIAGFDIDTPMKYVNHISKSLMNNASNRKNIADEKGLGDISLFATAKKQPKKL